MKRIVSLSFLFLFFFIKSFGQWYVKKYNVANINLLTQVQLEKSLAQSKKNLVNSGVVTGIGGLFFAIGRYAHPGMSDDPSLVEQLIGDEGMDKIAMVVGIGMVTGGAIAGFSYFGRIENIKSALKRNYPGTSHINISPTILLQNNIRLFSPGATLVYTF